MNHLNYKDIILIPNQCTVSSRSDCNTGVTLGGFYFNSPVIPANMKSIITPEICKIFDDAGWLYVYHRIHGTKDVKDFVDYAEKNKFNVISISVGIKSEWSKLIEELANQRSRVDFITIDVAHSHTSNVFPIVDTINKHFPNAYVILGNGCTRDWVQWAEENFIKGITQKVHALKVGIGVSTACRTRQYTGFGSSTVTSLLECVNEARGTFDIISDGGITIEGDTIHIGDVAKSIVLGSKMVMSGVLFSRCSDSPSAKYNYYGNASFAAKGGSRIEGASVRTSSDGMKIKEMMTMIIESLQSSISYSGGKTLYHLQQRTKWDTISN